MDIQPILDYIDKLETTEIPIAEELPDIHQITPEATLTISYDDELNNRVEVQLVIKGILPEDGYEHRFKLFEALEAVLWSLYQNYQNNDPCDFNYDFDTDHLGEQHTYSVLCTDYFS